MVVERGFCRISNLMFFNSGKSWSANQKAFWHSSVVASMPIIECKVKSESGGTDSRLNSFTGEFVDELTTVFVSWALTLDCAIESTSPRNIIPVRIYLNIKLFFGYGNN